MKIKIVIPLWGEAYIENFIKLILPSHLFENNLPLLGCIEDIKYVFYTTKSSKNYLTKALHQTQLNNYARIEIKLIPENLSKNTYKAYGKVHKNEINFSRELNEIVFCLNSDIFLSDGLFPKIRDIIKSGYKVVQVVCPRTLISEKLTKQLFGLPNTISSEKLIDIWHSNRHPLMEFHQFPKSIGSSFHPSTLYWHVGKSSSYFRNFHLHPIAIHSFGLKSIHFGNTVDDGWIFNSFKQEEIYVETENQDFFSIELSEASKTFEPACAYGDFKSYAQYFLSNNMNNFSNFNHEITIGKPDNELLNYAKIQADAEVQYYLLHTLLQIQYIKNLKIFVKIYQIFLTCLARQIAPKLKKLLSNNMYNKVKQFYHNIRY